MLLRLLSSAMCVQNFDDSRSSAIRITYRISLRSSSLWDPRHPLLKVVIDYTARRARDSKSSLDSVTGFSSVWRRSSASRPAHAGARFAPGLVYISLAPGAPCTVYRQVASGTSSRGSKVWNSDNDPSAGSPTETLLRLHLPLNDKV